VINGLLQTEFQAFRSRLAMPPAPPQDMLEIDDEP